MAKIDARDWIFEVQTAPTTWVEIDGINSWELDKNANSETTDDTRFKSKGVHEGHVSQRGASITLEGEVEVDDDNPATRDPGQVAFDAWAEKVGRASLTGFRFRHEAQPTWTVWKAFAEGGSEGGGNNDNTSWGGTVTRSGAATTAAVTP